ncbi:MAG: hypothetical protein QT12_C0019G0003 [archaeon GW2011_AR21]|uniref:Uncharacterized protein n=1 Tax=Candidatus Iainarchaeum sp. TaxID=3101447 RepID=A0A7J4JYC9_9ARCH|nr:MAG: hypothetical protein QT12_C0019G0003 [archaeon GW2011_AR21]HIH21679.1 hypothetical protein [Candidatus Diapherotrites archaeon]
MVEVRKARIIVLLALVLLASFVIANQQTTTMTWVVPSNKSHSISYPGGCSQEAFFFVESNAVIDNDVDGNANQILPYTNRTGGSACQSDSLAGILITNNGNAAANIDANFGAALDINIWLKVWMGGIDTAGCGTAGFGGWQRTCTLLSTTAPVTSAACKDFNIDNATTNTRLVTTLPVGDSNKLCFSGEFMGDAFKAYSAVIPNDYNGTLQTSTDLS